MRVRGWLIGGGGCMQGVFKLKSMLAGTEEDVPQTELVEVLKAKLQELGPLSVIATRTSALSLQ